MIPMLDLTAQYKSIKSEIDSAIASVLDSGQFVLGEEVSAFETEFAAYCGTHFAIGLNSGTSALHLALLAAGIGPNDEVITVPFTFVASIAAIIYTGAKPKFVDIDAQSLTIDANLIESAITPCTRAILPVHLYGQAADMEPITEIARQHGLLVIEDASQAHGAEYKGRRVGGIGDLGCFSLYPGKNLGAYGEAGVVVTNSPEYAHKIRRLRNWGENQNYSDALKGFNYRMDAIQAAILRVKLAHLEAWIKAREVNASLYDSHLFHSGVQTPTVIPHRRHVYHIYAVRLPARDTLRQYLYRRGIQTCVHYPIPVHLQEAYSDLGYRLKDFPIAERASEQVLSLPVHPELTFTQIESIAFTIRDGVPKMLAKPQSV